MRLQEHLCQIAAAWRHTPTGDLFSRLQAELDKYTQDKEVTVDNKDKTMELPVPVAKEKSRLLKWFYDTIDEAELDRVKDSKRAERGEDWGVR